ncbi:hypothetical protein CsatB_020823 [Cannabis sativa]
MFSCNMIQFNINYFCNCFFYFPSFLCKSKFTCFVHPHIFIVASLSENQKYIIFFEMRI